MALLSIRKVDLCSGPQGSACLPTRVSTLRGRIGRSRDHPCGSIQSQLYMFTTLTMSPHEQVEQLGQLVQGLRVDHCIQELRDMSQTTPMWTMHKPPTRLLLLVQQPRIQQIPASIFQLIFGVGWYESSILLYAQHLVAIGSPAKSDTPRYVFTRTWHTAH
jgi:hypothetical protein